MPTSAVKKKLRTNEEEQINSKSKKKLKFYTDSERWNFIENYQKN